MIDVSELNGDPDFAQTITRKRSTLTYANEGTPQKSYATASIVANVQSPSPSDVQLLPEGVRLNDVMAIFTTAGNITAGDGTTVLPDVLIIEGQSYQVLHVEDFSRNGYVMALAQRFAPGVSA
jgi:hypothetical protein